MRFAFAAIILVGGLWMAYNLGSDRRNPPMKKCPPCGGDGVLWSGGRDQEPHTVKCFRCDGDGWVES